MQIGSVFPLIVCPEEARPFKYSTEKAIKVPDVTASSARCKVLFYCFSVLTNLSGLIRHYYVEREKGVESVGAKHVGAALGDVLHVRSVSPVTSAPPHTAIRFNYFILSQIAFLAANFDNGVS